VGTGGGGRTTHSVLGLALALTFTVVVALALTRLSLPWARLRRGVASLDRCIRAGGTLCTVIVVVVLGGVTLSRRLTQRLSLGVHALLALHDGARCLHKRVHVALVLQRA
jgi:hypothetical protein